MGVIIRQSIKSSIAIFIGVIFGMLNRLILFPGTLTEMQIGLIQVIIAVAILLAQLGQWGSSSTITKFFEHFKKKDILPEFLGVTFLSSLTGFLIFTGLFFLFQDQVFTFFHKEMALVSDYSLHIVAISLFIIIGYLASTVSYNFQRVTFPSLMNNLVTKALISCAVLAYYFKVVAFNNFIVLYSLTYAVAALAIVIYVRKYFQVKVRFNFKKFGRPDYLKTVKYSSFVWIGAVSTVITHSIDSLMLSGMEGLSATGIYSIAFFMGVIIEIPKKATSFISSPIISKHWENGRIGDIRKLYHQTSINQGIAAFTLFILLFASLDEVFSLIPNSDVYVTGKYVALIIGFSKVLDMISGSNSEILKTSDRYKWDFILMVFFIAISIVTNLILIPMYSLNGAALATLISVFFYNLFRFVLLKRFYSLDPFNKNTVKLIAVSVVMMAIIYFVPNLWNSEVAKGMTVLVIVLKSTLIGVAFILTIYKLNISEDFNRLIKDSLNKFKRK